MNLRFLSLLEVSPNQSPLTDEISGMVYSLSLGKAHIDRLVKNWIGQKETAKNNWRKVLLKKLKEAAEALKPGIVKKIEFFEKENS